MTDMRDKFIFVLTQERRASRERREHQRGWIGIRTGLGVWGASAALDSFYCSISSMRSNTRANVLRANIATRERKQRAILTKLVARMI